MNFFKYAWALSDSHWKISVVSSRIDFHTSSSSRFTLSGVKRSIPASLQVSLITPQPSSPSMSSLTYIKSSSSFMLSIDTGYSDVANVHVPMFELISSSVTNTPLGCEPIDIIVPLTISTYSNNSGYCFLNSSGTISSTI